MYTQIAHTIFSQLSPLFLSEVHNNHGSETIPFQPETQSQTHARAQRNK